MNKNAELLNYIYQNSQMGVHTLEQLIKITTDTIFKTQLEFQYNGYEEIHIEAKKLLNKNGYDEKGINTFDKVKTYLMINMQTMTDKSVSHIAKMLIIGSNMGIIDAIQNLKKYYSCEYDIIELMQKLKTFEENSVAKLKNFL